MPKQSYDVTFEDLISNPSLIGTIVPSNNANEAIGTLYQMAIAQGYDKSQAADVATELWSTYLQSTRPVSAQELATYGTEEIAQFNRGIGDGSYREENDPIDQMFDNPSLVQSQYVPVSNASEFSDVTGVFQQNMTFGEQSIDRLRKQIEQYSNQLKGYTKDATVAYIGMAQAQRNAIAQALTLNEKIQSDRISRINTLNDMVNKHNTKFGSALNNKAIEVLKTFANINAPTFTSIMLGWEMARQSQADRSVQAIKRQAELDDRALKLEEAQAKYNEDYAKAQFQQKYDEAAVALREAEQMGANVKDEMKMVAEIGKAATQVGADFARLALQLDMSQREIDARYKIAAMEQKGANYRTKLQVESQEARSQERNETQIEMANIRAATSRYAADLRGEIARNASQDNMKRDYFKFLYAMELGLSDGNIRERLWGQRLDFESDKLRSEEERYVLGLADKERQRQFLLEKAQGEYDARKEIQQMITDRVTKIVGDQIDAKRVMQLALFEHKNESQQREFQNAVDLLTQRGEQETARLLLRIASEAEQKNLDREERREALERKVQNVIDAINTKSLNEQEAVRLKHDLNMIRDELLQGYDVENIRLRHRNRIDEIDTVAGLSRDASFDKFIQNYVLQEERLSAQREIAILNNEAQNERLVTRLMQNAAIRNAGFDHDILMAVLNADIEDAQRSQKHKDDLEKIGQRLELQGYNDEAKQVRDFIFQSELNKQNNEAQSERQALRLEAWERREQQRNEAQNERLVARLMQNAAIKSAGFNHDILMAVLNADIEDAQQSQKHINDLEKIRQRLELQGYNDEAKQVRDFIFQSERQALRLEAWERREQQRNEAQNERLQISLNAKADQLLFKHYSDAMLQDQKHAGVMELFNAQANANRENLLKKLDSAEFIAAARLEQSEVESIRNFINKEYDRIQRGEQFDDKLAAEAERIDKILQNKQQIAGLSNEIKLQLGEIRASAGLDRKQTNFFLGNTRSAISDYVRYLDVERKAKKDQASLTQSEKELLEKGRQFDKKLEESARQANQKDAFNKWKAEISSFTTTNAQLLRNQGALDVVNIRELQQNQRKLWDLEARKNELTSREKIEYDKLKKKVEQDNKWIDQHVEDRNVKERLTQRGQDVSYARTLLQEIGKSERELQRLNVQRDKNSEENKLKRAELEARIEDSKRKLEGVRLTNEGKLELEQIRGENRSQDLQMRLGTQERISQGSQNARVRVEEIRQAGAMNRLMQEQAFKNLEKIRQDEAATKASTYMQNILNATLKFGPGSEEEKAATEDFSRFTKENGIVLSEKVITSFNADKVRAANTHYKGVGKNDKGAAIAAALEGAKSPEETMTPEQLKENNRTTFLKRVATKAYELGAKLKSDQVVSIAEGIAGEGNEYIPDVYAAALGLRDIDSRIEKGITNFITEQERQQQTTRVKEAEERNAKNRTYQQLLNQYRNLTPDQVEAIPDPEIREAYRRLGYDANGKYNARKYRSDFNGQFLQLLIRKHEEANQQREPSTFEFNPRLGENEQTKDYAYLDQNKVSTYEDVEEDLATQIPQGTNLAVASADVDTGETSFYNNGGLGMLIERIPDEVEPVAPVAPVDQIGNIYDDTLPV